MEGYLTCLLNSMMENTPSLMYIDQTNSFMVKAKPHTLEVTEVKPHTLEVTEAKPHTREVTEAKPHA